MNAPAKLLATFVALVALLAILVAAAVETLIRGKSLLRETED